MDKLSSKNVDIAWDGLSFFVKFCLISFFLNFAISAWYIENSSLVTVLYLLDALLLDFVRNWPKTGYNFFESSKSKIIG